MAPMPGRRPLLNRTPTALFRQCLRGIRMPNSASLLSGSSALCELAWSAVRSERKPHHVTERIGLLSWIRVHDTSSNGVQYTSYLKN